MSGGVMRVAYFVHDLTDPAVARRVAMLRAGGAEVVVFGFRRADEAPGEVGCARAIDLGRTYDGRFGQRVWRSAVAAAGVERWRGQLVRADVVLARTLEMLAVAEAAQVSCGLNARLVYECLDIHRLMLDAGPRGQVLRFAERELMRRAHMLVVSSPAFLSQYFEPVQGLGRDVELPSLLVENKVLDLDGQPPARQAPPPGPPWRIGWLGAIRCQKSLDILADLVTRRPDLVEVEIHGRPAYGEFRDFDAQVDATPGLRFGGGYTAQDLPALYGRVHFSWAIDFMEEGLNSAWLLPNRLYESSRHGAVPIALSDVETGRYLADCGFGLPIAEVGDLEAVLDGLTAEGYAGLRAGVESMPDETFAVDRAGCKALVRALAGGLIPHAEQPDTLKAKLVA
jgi:hypothetical protein